MLLSCGISRAVVRLCLEYNTTHPGTKLSEGRVSEYENWPHGGTRPSLHYLANLAATFGHGCTPALLVDADDLAELTSADRCLLTTGEPPLTDGATVPDSRLRPPQPGSRATGKGAVTTFGDPADSVRAHRPGHGDTGLVRRSRRIVRCDARGVPVGEEVIMAAEESAQFWRWSATVNVDDAVLEQMAGDVVELAGVSRSTRRPPRSRPCCAPGTTCSR